jgi:excisionase family DNA binding protein
MTISKGVQGVEKMEAAPKVLTVNELAEYLRVHRSTIYRLLKKGQLPGFKIGSDWRFNVEVIDEWRLKQGAGFLEEEASIEPMPVHHAQSQRR